MTNFIYKKVQKRQLSLCSTLIPSSLLPGILIPHEHRVRFFLHLEYKTNWSGHQRANLFAQDLRLGILKAETVCEESTQVLPYFRISILFVCVSSSFAKVADFVVYKFERYMRYMLSVSRGPF